MHREKGLEEIKGHLIKKMKFLRRLPKIKDPGKFFVPCSILGAGFKYSLCDTRSSVNVMSMAIAKNLEITNLTDPPCSLKFADASTMSRQGFIHNLDV